MDRLVLFDYFFGANDGKIVNSSEYISDQEIKRLISKNKPLAKIFSEYLKVKEKDIAVTISFSQWVIKRTIENFGGLAIGNRYTMYDGFEYFNSMLNKNVRRYDSDKRLNDFESKDPVFDERSKLNVKFEDAVNVYFQREF
mgnify:CR=1 FL=1